MARLPTPGGDDGTWGAILNKYLRVSLDPQGALKSGTVSNSQLQDSAVTDAKISSQAAISKSKLSPGVQSSLGKADSALPTSGGTLTGDVTSKDGSLLLSRTAANALYLAAAQPEAFGAAGNGSTDDTAAVQAAINSGKFVWFSASYKITAALTIPANCPGLYLAPGSQIIKAYAGDLSHNYTQDQTSLFCNADLTTPLSGFVIIGTGKIINPDITNNVGRVMTLYGHGMLFEGFSVDGLSKSGFAWLQGDRMRISHINVINAFDATGVTGIRFLGGTDFRCVGAHVESGDDTFCFVPQDPGNTSTLPKSVDISNAFYIGCTGSSTQANLCKVSLNADGALSMTNSIYNAGYIGIAGIGGAAGAVTIQNRNSSGRIEVYLDDLRIDPGTGAGICSFFQQAASIPGIGSMRVRARNIKVTSLSISANETNQIDFADIDGAVLTPTTSTAVTVTGCKDLRYKGGFIDMAGMPSSGNVYGFRLGNSNSSVRTWNSHIENVVVRNVPNNNSAYMTKAEMAVSGSIRRCEVSSISGATVGNAILITSQASGFAVEGNDLSAVISKITNNATDSIIRGNLGVNPKGSITPPGVGSSGVAVTNTTGYDCAVVVATGSGVTVSAISVGGTATGLTVAASSAQSIRVPANQTITLTYSGGTPTWKWFAD